MAIALVTAAVTDLRRREIDNWLNAAIAAGAPLYWIASGLTPVECAYQVGLALVTFVLTTTLFVIRQMGGGDVKLLTALSLWFVPQAFMPLVMMMAVVGGGGSVAMALGNMHRRPGEAVRDVYSALVACLFIWACGSLAWAMITGRPAVDPETVGYLYDHLRSAWALAAVGAVLLVLVMTGLSHIMRRQKSKLPIPYGVAISVAGLWALADHVTSTGPLAGALG